MLEIKSKLKIARSAYKLEVKGLLQLPFELRQKTRQRTQLVSGEEVAVSLPRGEVLRGGDLLVASDGRVVEVIAAPEALLHVECDGARSLALAAYHLGSRHVSLQIGENFLRTSADHVLEQMLKGLGIKTRAVTEAFEPESGAYGGDHEHADGAHIHEYGDAHEDHHDHDHDHGHGHGHGHAHDKDHARDKDPGHDHDHRHGHGHGKGH